MKTIVLTHAAAKDLDSLPSNMRTVVANALIDYAVTGRGDVKALRGRDGYRLRIGRRSVLFDEDQTTILAIYIGKRETTTYRSPR
jgi:mRNA interferase RelE/StbE